MIFPFIVSIALFAIGIAVFLDLLERLKRIEKTARDQFDSLDTNQMEIILLLARIERAVKPRHAHRIVFYVGSGQQKVKVDSIMNLKVTQFLPLSIKIEDKLGNAAVVDGAPVWSLTDPALGDLEVAEGGLSAKLMPKGPLGEFKVQVKADADLGEGVKEILGELPVTLVAGDAAVVAIAAGEPVDV